jgi:hypothetical protein
MASTPDFAACSASFAERAVVGVPTWMMKKTVVLLRL